MPLVQVLCGLLLVVAGVEGAVDLTGMSLHRVSDGTGISSDATLCGKLLAVGEGPKDRVTFYMHDSVNAFPRCGVFVSESPGWNQRYGQQVQCIEAAGQTAWIAVLGASITEVLKVVWEGSPATCSAVSVTNMTLDADVGMSMMHVWKRDTGDLILSHGNIKRGSIVISKLSRKGDVWTMDTAVAFLENVTANGVDVVFDPKRDMIVVVDPVKESFSRYSLLNTAFYSAGRINTCDDLAAVSSTGPVSCGGQSSVCFVDGESLVASSYANRVEVTATSSGSYATGESEVRTSFSTAHGVAPKLICPETGASLGLGALVVVSSGEVYTLVEPQDGVWCAFEVASPCDNTCGLGMQDWNRTCECPPPRYGGLACGGPAAKVEPCEFYTHHWQTTAFGNCSSKCGRGLSCRTVQCDRCDGQASDLCDASQEPASCQDCMELPSYWVSSPYSTCSATKCMEVGKKTRTVACEPCTPEDNGSYANETFEPCSFDSRPADFDPCQFVSFSWWTANKEYTCKPRTVGAERPDGCINGYQETMCLNCVGTPDAESNCVEERPKVDCIVPVYDMDWRSWTACDATCGIGISYRVPYCYKKCDASKQEVNPGYCPEDLPEPREVACTVHRGGKGWTRWEPCAFPNGQTCGTGTESRRCQWICNSSPTTGCPGESTRECRTTCPKGGGCHPASSVVVSPTGPVSVKDIRSGDLILTCAADDTAKLSQVTGRQSGCYFTKVYGFHHAEETDSLEYVEVQYSSDCTAEGKLRLSKDHLFVANGVFIEAQFAKVGDVVITSCDANGTYRRAVSTISGIEIKTDVGQYAFGTDSGDALVDGILSSNYAGDLPQWRFQLIFLPLRALMSTTGSYLTSDAEKFHWYVIGLCSLGGRTDLSGGNSSTLLTVAVATMLVFFFVVLPRSLAAIVVGAAGLGKAQVSFCSDVVHLGFVVWCCLVCGAADEVPAVQVLLGAGLVLWFARSVQSALSCVPELSRELPSRANAARFLNVLCGVFTGWAWMRGDNDMASIRSLVTPDVTAAAIIGGLYLLRSQEGSLSKGSRMGPVLGLLICSLLWQVAAGADVGQTAEVHETSRVLGTETDHVVQFTAQSTVHMPCKGQQSHTTGCTESVSGHRVGNMRFSRVGTAGGEFCYSVELLMFAEHQDRVTPFLTVHPDIEEWNKVPLTVCRSMGWGVDAPVGSPALRFYVPTDAKLSERTREKIRFLQPFDLLITHGEGGVCETWVPAESERRHRHDNVHNATLDHAITAEFADGLLKQVTVATNVRQNAGYVSAETTADATVLHETPRLKRGARVLNVAEQQEVFLHSEATSKKPATATNKWFEEFEGICADAEVSLPGAAKRGKEHPVEAAEVLRSMLMAPYETSERVRFLFIAGFMAEEATAELLGWCAENAFCSRGLQMEDTGRILSSAALSWENRWGTTQPRYSKAAMALLTTRRADDYSVGDLTYTALQHAETARHHDDAATKYLSHKEWDHTWRAIAAHNMKMTPATRAALHVLVDDTCSSTADLHSCTPYLKALKKDPRNEGTRDKLIEVASMHPHTTARLRAVELLMDRVDVSCGHMQYLMDTEKSERIRAAISTIKPTGGRCFRVLGFDKKFGFPVKERKKQFGGDFAKVMLVSTLGAELKFKGSAEWTDLSFDFRAEAVAKAGVVVSALSGFIEKTVLEGGVHFKAKVAAGFDFSDIAAAALGDTESQSHERLPTKRRSAKSLQVREMSPLATHLPLMPYIDLPAIATESTEKLQAFCDRLLELNFPFYAEKPYTASGCTADIAKHPWSLFRYIYDRQENTTSNDAAIAQAVFSENAERWVEWKSSHDTSCLQIWPDLSQFERYGAASTFSYMSDTRMCAVAEALSGSCRGPRGEAQGGNAGAVARSFVFLGGGFLPVCRLLLWFAWGFSAVFVRFCPSILVFRTSAAAEWGGSDGCKRWNVKTGKRSR